MSEQELPSVEPSSEANATDAANPKKKSSLGKTIAIFFVILLVLIAVIGFAMENYLKDEMMRSIEAHGKENSQYSNAPASLSKSLTVAPNFQSKSTQNNIRLAPNALPTPGFHQDSNSTEHQRNRVSGNQTAAQQDVINLPNPGTNLAKIREITGRLDSMEQDLSNTNDYVEREFSAIRQQVKNTVSNPKQYVEIINRLNKTQRQMKRLSNKVTRLSKRKRVSTKKKSVTKPKVKKPNFCVESVAVWNNQTTAVVQLPGKLDVFYKGDVIEAFNVLKINEPGQWLLVQYQNQSPVRVNRCTTHG